MIRPCPDGRHNFNLDLHRIGRVFPCLNKGCPISLTATELNDIYLLTRNRSDIQRVISDLVTKKERDWWVEWEIQG